MVEERRNIAEERARLSRELRQWEVLRRTMQPTHTAQIPETHSDFYDAWWGWVRSLINRGLDIPPVDRAVIPLPVSGCVTSTADCTESRVRDFVLHSARLKMKGGSKTKAVREELLIWHPDKFAIFLSFVKEDQKDDMQKIAQGIAMRLIDILAALSRESS
ncbi:hypothetical protein WOLCODRAFT_155110 [Wolfiporia cocos MD-104 SS10]|uniref:Uncharacterized protein n=1 Tax=Wolfiporia cocos (strain MD-104) TaxID=742152 RepID=A0A2H3JT03_WOLCO|nr:hypothetical protein WOLCODRAFT_155110 [Wolfiporia cocos MD-104 SS10]